jgi:aldose 1-epimerase
MDIKTKPFGLLPDGGEVVLFTLVNSRGMKLRLINLGATIVGLETPDRRGNFANVALGLDSLEDYLRGHPCLGSTVGRYANRIARGRFSLDGREYRLATNNGPNHLHGGPRGFDKILWRAETLSGDGFIGVRFSYLSPDGDEGYPGNLNIAAVYGLTENDELHIDYTAVTDRPTIVNLTNHAYWNLTDGGAGDVLGHLLTIEADRYLPADEGLIPLGELKSVAGTPLDFLLPTPIGARIEQLGQLGGYDHCYVLNKPQGTIEPALAATLVSPDSGRMMEVFTTQPGVQLFSGNCLDGTLRASGKVYRKYAGVCLETQHFPDSPNHPHFPSTILRPGQTYRQTTIHRFSAD